MYYDTCDVSLSTLEDLPEDDVPEDLHYENMDEDLPTGHVSSELFRDWINLGRHDCAVAKALGYTWSQELKTCGNETVGDFFAAEAAKNSPPRVEPMG